MIRKRGTAKVFSAWWVLMIVFVIGGVVGGVTMFYSAEVDVRTLEAKIITDKVERCFFGQGKLNDFVLEESFDFFSDCNFEEELFGDGENYFVRVSLFVDEEEIGDFSYGRVSFERSCEIQEGSSEEEGVTGENLAKCYGKEVKFHYDGGTGTADILAASNQRGRRSQDVLQE